MGLKKDYGYQFERVWKSYPLHVAKAEAAKEFDKLKLTEGQVEELVLHIEERKRYDVKWLPNKDGNTFVPHLSRFLKHRRFEDEYQRVPRRAYDVPHETPPKREEARRMDPEKVQKLLDEAKRGLPRVH